MSDQVVSGLVAVLLGGLVGTLLFVPFVTITYRRHGRMTAWQFLTWAAALVYVWAIWTYTLLPLPSSDDYRCVGYSLDPSTVVSDVRQALAAGSLLHPGIMQLVLNVALFVPLGVLLRVLAGRGVIVALIAGAGVSLLIECTQLTGVWGLYPCAYRLFDVVDITTNTLGAVVGSLLALALPRRLHGVQLPSADADVPRPVTKRRRMLGAFCDVTGAALVSWFAAAAVQIGTALVLGAEAVDPHGEQAEFVGSLVVIAVWTAVILLTGRSIGDIAVRIHYRDGGAPEPIARVGRAAGGIVGLTMLGLLPFVGAFPAGLVGFVALVLTLATRQGRGLPGLLTGRLPVDARAPRPRADASVVRG